MMDGDDSIQMGVAGHRFHRHITQTFTLALDGFCGFTDKGPKPNMYSKETVMQAKQVIHRI